MNEQNPENIESVPLPDEKKEISYSIGVECPVCKSLKSRVLDKRNSNKDTILRRKVCENGHRYSTVEVLGQRDSYTNKMKVKKTPLTDEEIKSKFPRVKDALLTHLNFKEFIKSIYNL